MAGKFMIEHGKAGQFHLKAGNGQIVATSALYTTRAACLDGIELGEVQRPRRRDRRRVR